MVARFSAVTSTMLSKRDMVQPMAWRCLEREARSIMSGVLLRQMVSGLFCPTTKGSAYLAVDPVSNSLKVVQELLEFCTGCFKANLPLSI